MKLEGKKIGLAITGSFCTFSKMEEAVTALMAEGASIYPIISTNVPVSYTHLTLPTTSRV